MKVKCVISVATWTRSRGGAPFRPQGLSGSGEHERSLTGDVVERDRAEPTSEITSITGVRPRLPPVRAFGAVARDLPRLWHRGLPRGKSRSAVGEHRRP